MSQLSSRIARALAVSLTVVAVVAACGSEGGSTFDPNGNDGGGASNGSTGTTSGSIASTSGIGGTSGSSGDGGDGTSSSSSGNIDPGCKPLTCAEQGLECGLAGDGCGRQIDCNKTVAEGGCSDDPTKRCGAEGAPSKCVAIVNIPNTCTPKSCSDLGVTCGQAGDGCGGLLTCGTCAADEQCGGPGRPSQCVKITATSADGGACVPKTAADFPTDTCGDQSDGCGGTVTFSATCPTQGEFCGGDGPSRCGPPGGSPCTPKTCADYPANVCGVQSDGCGGVTATACGTPCAPPQVCGGGGVPSQCGGGVLTDDAGNSCTPKSTCGPLECGQVADGCGGVFDCGLSRCTGNQICGGGGAPNICGAPACTRLSRAQACLNKNCGPVSDGCGGTYNCNANDAATACTAPQICGGGGVPNVCGGGAPTADGGPGGGTCVPKTAAACTAGDCGPINDGCGGVYYCCNGAACATNPPPSTALCAAGNTCGAITASKCGSPQCTPLTQAAACGGTPAKNCGFVPDGCGGSHQCGVGTGACPVGANVGDTCGGGGQANVCGGGVPCTGFCQQVDRSCTANNETRITGKVWAPSAVRTGGNVVGLPLPNALVYVPNGNPASNYGVTALPQGVAGAGACQTCVNQVSGALVSTTTDYDGSFTLRNVPAGVSFPLVIQLGKWRRMITVGSVPACTSAALEGQNGNRPIPRLPTRQGEGNAVTDNIPFIGISTGRVDGLECVFRKLGLEDNQFGNPVGTSTLDRGRIRLHRHNDYSGGNDEGGAVMDGNTPRTNSSLTDTQAHLDQYDAVIFSCPGAERRKTDTQEDRVVAYANKGGRVFATHFEYVYLDGTSPFSTMATWNPGEDSAGNGSWTGVVDETAGRRLTFSRWLGAPGVTALSNTNPPRVSITEARNDVDTPAVNGAQSWITHGSDDMLHFTFDTPVGQANQCGRVLFSDFHVSLGTTAGQTFPDHCSGNLTSQEKILAFFLFDLTSCIDSGPPPATCTKRTCASYPQTSGSPPGAICGQYSDGCGDLIRVDPNNPNSNPQSCGTCPSGQACVGGYCQIINCTPNTCQAGQCGSIPDGCGGTLNCTCPPGGGTCGGGGQANRCGTPSCTPLTCTAGFCGSTGNGCGGTLDCTCPPGQLCGGAGQPNQCGVCTPIPQATACAGKNCGDVPNGCSGFWHCGDCASGQNCGGSGQANVCGSGSCVARSCAEMGAQCGRVGDGCGGFTDCPNCTGTDFCNGDNLCIGTTCTPKTCQQQGIECGPASDTCGGLIANCGDCPPGTACGAGGQPGKCGTIPCTPSTCTSLGAVCGQVANGCGGLTQSCGSCPGTNSCVNGACVQTCTPRTCTEAAAQCGFVGDGCGGALDCGQCQPGQTCGAGNRCIDDGPK